MDIAVFFFILFFPTIFLSTASLKADSTPLNCNNTSSITSPPHLHFPFNRSNPSSFKLYCKNNTPMIHFPNYGHLTVKSISFNDRKLQLADPNSCVHQVFLNLDLSFTPFEYYYVVRNYTYLNCSTRIKSLAEIPCLSGSRHHVYSVNESCLGLDLPVSCREVKTVAVPYNSFSPYLNDDSFGLVFTWSLIPGIQQHNKFGKQWSLVGLCIFAVAIVLLRMKIYHPDKVGTQTSNLLEILNYSKNQHAMQ